MDITDNVAYSFGPMPLGGQACIQLTGDFGGGTATIGFIPTGGAFTACGWPADGTPIELTANGFVTIWIPKDALITIDLNGATDPVLVAHCWPTHFPTTRQF